MPSSGAKLYVQTKPEWSMPALRVVCSVLEEADIEIPPDGKSSAPRLFTSPEGRPWGRPRVGSASLQQQWEAQLGITAASVSAAAKGEVEMAPDKVRGLLGRIAMFTATEPFNSNISRFAQGLAVQLCIALRRRLGEQWNFEANKILDSERSIDRDRNSDIREIIVVQKKNKLDSLTCEYDLV